MRTLRSRYRQFKLQQIAEYRRFERERDEAPLLRALVTPNRRPPAKGIGDFALFAIREKLVARNMSLDPLIAGHTIQTKMLESVVERRRKLATKNHMRLVPNRQRLNKNVLRK